MQGVTAAQVYYQRKHLVDQEMTNGLRTNVAARVAADYLAPGVVNDKVGDISKGKYVAARGLTASKPGPATWEPRMPVPSGIEAQALKAPAESRANRRPDRRYPKCRKLRNRNVCKDSQPVGLLTEARDPRFAQISDGSRRPEASVGSPMVCKLTELKVIPCSTNHDLHCRGYPVRPSTGTRSCELCHVAVLDEMRTDIRFLDALCPRLLSLCLSFFGHL